jgi:hypothetical protein
MRIIVIFFMSFIALDSYSQFDVRKLKFEGCIGSHFNHSKLSEGYTISDKPYEAVGIAASYMKSKKICYRLEVGADFNRPTESSNYFRNDYYRVSFCVGTDLFSYIFDRHDAPKIIRPTAKSFFQLYLYAGAGFSTMQNQMPFEPNLTKKYLAYDYMYNLTAGVMPTIRLTSNHSIFFKVNFNAHIRQAYNFDMTDYNPNTWFDGGFYNAMIGFSFRPFKPSPYSTYGSYNL